ncbi:cat eye syndrome critical region 2-like isoform X2 [Brachionus plicatilis]|uniref:Cat eye syndrome critical region 2-like isoform X2 n=1 Tax=Brachionus plicatilis TaxID=10195 RepID=A0A3M7RP59_BRAPC|nr:cat eye syndrome critical region 2-like isoform X2 [Brachionus plicatilis]
MHVHHSHTHIRQFLITMPLIIKYASMPMEDLRRCRKVFYIVYYFNLFEKELNLIDLRLDEFKNALLEYCGNQRSIAIVHVLKNHQSLHQQIKIDLKNFGQYLLQVLHRFLVDFILAKLDIIFRLRELKLSLKDIKAKLRDYGANVLRLELLAVESVGTMFWYFGDLRLYEARKQERIARLFFISFCLDNEKRILRKTY